MGLAPNPDGVPKGVAGVGAGAGVPKREPDPKGELDPNGAGAGVEANGAGAGAVANGAGAGAVAPAVNGDALFWTFAAVPCGVGSFRRTDRRMTGFNRICSFAFVRATLVPRAAKTDV